MPVTSVGLYELVLEQEYFSLPVLNVFHYLSATADDDVQDLCATAFDEDLMAIIAPSQNTTLLYKNIRCANITGGGADFNLTPSQGDGDIVGSVVAGFTSNSFRYNRTTKETRNGAKRFTAMVEENIIGSSFTVPYNAVLDALATALSQQITTVGGVFDPIILRKPDDGFGNYTYNVLASVQNLDRVTTQNSRKNF